MHQFSLLSRKRMALCWELSAGKLCKQRNKEKQFKTKTR